METMTQGDKNLLLKDLCARLPYGVKVNVIYSNENASSFRQRVCVEGDNELNTDIIGLYQRNEIDIKPYLFPLSSMTTEQKRELRQLDAFVSTFGQICFYTYDDYGHELMPTYEDAIRITNWLIKNNFDYQGLIPKDLAIDATGLNIY